MHKDIHLMQAATNKKDNNIVVKCENNITGSLATDIIFIKKVMIM